MRIVTLLIIFSLQFVGFSASVFAEENVNSFCKNEEIFKDGKVICEVDREFNDPTIITKTRGMIKSFYIKGTLSVEITADSLSKYFTATQLSIPPQNVIIDVVFFDNSRYPLSVEFAPYAILDGADAKEGFMNVTKLTSTRTISPILLNILKNFVNNSDDIKKEVQSYAQKIIDNLSKITS